MRINAGTLALHLEADLVSAGWNGLKTSFPGQTKKQAAIASLSKSCLKKYLEGTADTSPEGDSKALELFTQVNDSCSRFVLDLASRPSWVRVAFGEAQAFLYDFFYPCGRSSEMWNGQDFILSLHEISKGFGCGPGSSLGSKSTDLYSKFATSNLAATSPALHMLYKQTISHNPLWAGLDAFRSQKMGEAIVQESRLSFVPKYADISRTICTEPLLNMMFQKGIAAVLQRRLKQVTGIDLQSQQPKNQQLAQIGSETGRFGTIDLSSASDSMSLALVHKVFPADVVRWLERCRCAATILPDGSKLELHMISSMGNAFTFPLQTIFFTALVYGAYRSLGIRIEFPRGPSLGNFAVFGDDIIVQKEAYDLVTELLQVSGFSVNVDKSFNEGLFRESCGADFYQGYNVRGVYLKRLRDANDCYSAINRLNRWSAQHGVALPRLVGFLSHKCRFLPIPFDEGDSCGIKVPQSMLTGIKRHRGTNGIYYRLSLLSPRLVSVRPPYDRACNLPGWFENPDGLLFALLAGGIRDGFIGLRTIGARKASIRRRYSSRWDYIPFGCAERRDLGVGWKAYVSVNLGKV